MPAALVQDRTGRVGEKASTIFTQDQISFMHALVKSLVGKTEKLRNPYAPASLAWAAWIIARLGGWKGYSSQALPGVITMKRGLHDFTLYFNGWMVAKGRSP